MLDSIKSQKRGHFIFMHKSVVSRTARLGKLFFSMLYISSFTFGGGFVIATFMKEKFVDELHWIDEKEMLDITAILVGWQVDGLLGMFLAVLGTILPPMVTLSVISLFYAAFASNVYVAFALKGMQAGVAAVILDVVCGLGRNVLETHSPIYIGLMLLAFIASFVYDINVIFIILAATLFGIVRALLLDRKGGRL